MRELVLQLLSTQISETHSTTGIRLLASTILKGSMFTTTLLTKRLESTGSLNFLQKLLTRALPCFGHQLPLIPTQNTALKYQMLQLQFSIAKRWDGDTISSTLRPDGTPRRATLTTSSGRAMQRKSNPTTDHQPS